MWNYLSAFLFVFLIELFLNLAFYSSGQIFLCYSMNRFGEVSIGPQVIHQRHSQNHGIQYGVIDLHSYKSITLIVPEKDIIGLQEKQVGSKIKYISNNFWSILVYKSLGSINRTIMSKNFGNILWLFGAAIFTVEIY